ncbi:MAG: 30S ribosomal protein S17 [Euryarchaeota archaeon]|nr:30S ribosomal protein S17 [Euryarchaeota archaeon]
MECEDKNCPFHGTLKTREREIECVVVSDKMRKSVVVEREFLEAFPKYERFARKSSRITVHNPSCINAKVGDTVKISKCRPISKTKSFVIVEVL